MNKKTSSIVKDKGCFFVHIKKYIEDTVTSWEPNDDYTEGIKNTGEDILFKIEQIENGEYDDVEIVEGQSIDW